MHTDCHLDWNSNQPISAPQKTVNYALIYRAENVCSTPEVKAKEMDYPCIIHKNDLPDWRIIELEVKPLTPIINQDTGLRVKKNVFIFIPYIP